MTTREMLTQEMAALDEKRAALQARIDALPSEEDAAATLERIKQKNARLREQGLLPSK